MYQQLDLFELPYADQKVQSPITRTASVSELFAGAGGLALGLEKAGLKAKALIEIDTVLSVLESLGYNVQYRLLNAVHYDQDLRNCHNHWRCYALPCTKKLDQIHENIRSFQLLN